MSNESAPEILTHKDNRNVQVRLDYILLYRSEVKAKLVRILETWTNTKYAEWQKGVVDSKEQKAAPPEENLWITMSYDQFSLFVFGTIQRDTIKQQIDDLVALKHIQRRPHPDYPYGPPQYLLNRELVQEALNSLVIPVNLFDLTGTFISPRKKHTPPEKYPQGGGKKPGGDPGKIPPGTGEVSPPSNNISKNTKNHSKNRDTEAPQSDPTNEASATPSTPTEEVPYVPDFPGTENDSYSPVPPVSGYEKKEEDEDVRGSDRTGPTPGTEVPASPAPVVPQTRNTTHGGQARQSTATTRQGKGTTGNAQPEQTTLLVEKKPMSVEAQIDAAFQVLEHVKKQATGKPFGYVYTGAAKDSLKDLIKACKDTPNEINTANITLAWMAMWDSPRWSNGMSWQDPGKLTIAAFCRNYGEYLDKGRQAQEKPGETTEQPPSDEDAEREARNKRNKERSRKGAIAALQARIERNGKFQLYELKLMVEQFGMTLPPHLFSQYQASIPVHAQ